METESAGHRDELAEKLFEDEKVAERVAQDPLYVFVKNFWRQLLVAAIAIGAAVFIYQRFHDTYVQGMERGASVLSTVQRDYKRVVELGRQVKVGEAGLAKIGKDKVEAEQKKLDSLKTQQKEAHTQLGAAITALQRERPPYSNIAMVYQALVARTGGNLDGVRSALLGLDWQTITDTKSPQRLSAELGALVLAKSLLDNEITLAEGKSLLKALAEHGAIANVSAAISLSRIAQSDEERAAAQQTLIELKNKHPEQNNLLESEMGEIE